MKPRSGYRRVGNEEQGEDVKNPLQDIEMAGTSVSSQPTELKVLYKEQSHYIKNISGNTSVAQLKLLIAHATDVPVERQRLIISGKPLRPDDALLSSFHLEDGAKVHLFPLPVPAAPTPVPTAVAAPVSSVSGGVSFPNPHSSATSDRPRYGMGEMEGVRLTPAHYDPLVLQTGREIKMWCLLLIFLSAVSLFNNLSYFSVTGNFGSGNLDSFVFLLDTACSAAGMFVGGMGLKSIRTLDLGDLRKYLRHLMLLALACIVLRVCWVFDVSNAVHKAYRDAKHHQEEDAANGHPDPQPVDHKALAAFTIEATIIALGCIGAWLNCVSRAVRLHNAVLLHQAPTPADAAISSVAVRVHGSSSAV